jgi:hypothetical protein
VDSNARALEVDVVTVEQHDLTDPTAVGVGESEEKAIPRVRDRRNEGARSRWVR